jgi:integrase
MRKGKLQYVKAVMAKGKRYEYFDTGARNAAGRPVLARLPARSDPAFGNVYASFMAGRTRRANVAAELSIAGLVDRYHKSKRYADLAANTKANYDIYLRLIVEQFMPAPANAIERSDVRLMQTQMADRRGAANAAIRTMGALYAWGRKEELVTIDPTKNVELYDPTDYEPWPDDLLAAALASDDMAICLPVALLYFTAQRIGDVCAMRWNQVRDGFVILSQQKTGKLLDIRLHSKLAALLETVPRAGMTILTEERGRPTNDERVRKRLQAWATERGYKIVPHGLRKNAVIALLEVGCTIAETASVSGQSLAMIEHYAKRRSSRTLTNAAILKLEGGKR